MVKTLKFYQNLQSTDGYISYFFFLKVGKNKNDILMDCDFVRFNASPGGIYNAPIVYNKHLANPVSIFPVEEQFILDPKDFIEAIFEKGIVD